MPYVKSIYYENQERTEARLRWFGHVQRRDSEYVSRRMKLPGKRRRGRPKRRFMDVMGT